MVVLATLATIIASQAAITGSFSVAKQAVQLGFLPRLRIVHTSNLEGQIYVPLINWFLCVGVATLVLVFQSSNSLGDIYGVAVTGTFILNTILFLAVSRGPVAHPEVAAGASWATLFLTVEVAFFTSNLAKIDHGAWLSLAVGLAIATVMITWRRGRDIVTRNRTERGGIAGRVPGRPAARRSRRSSGCRAPRSSSTPDKATTPAGAADAGRAQPRLPREGRDRLDAAVSIPRVERSIGSPSSCWARACSRSSTSRSESATGTDRTSPRRWPGPQATGSWSATWTSSTPRTSSPG